MKAGEIHQINCRYADFLFAKGDYDNSMQQYIQAIESSEPSRVIRRFLGVQKIQNLIQYLEELHRHPTRVTTEHTTLLLNCYAKLKDVEKLANFIRSDNGQQFDLNTVLSLCRQAGYFAQAVYLAQKNSEYNVVMDILMEDMENFDDGMKYLVTLEPDVMQRNLMKWGRVLLDKLPNDTTTLLTKYFTGKYIPRTVASQDSPTGTQAIPSGFQGYAALLQLPYLGNTFSMTSTSAPDPDPVQPEPLPPTPPSYTPPPLRTAFSLFVDHPTEFVNFLEASLAELAPDVKVPEIPLTLLEMYLHSANQDEDTENKEWQTKARRMLESAELSLDRSNVLLLSHLCGFQEGTTFVREDQHLFFDIFRSYTANKDTAGVMSIVKRYGGDEPQLYPAALAYLTSSPEILQEAGDQLVDVLEVIEREGLMAPLQVVQILSKNGVATVRMVRKYLSGTIEKERLEIQQDQSYISGYRRDTLTRKKEINDLEERPVVFQPNRCSSCGTGLELPAVHFLCKHSFHQRCLNMQIEPPECPSCTPGNAAIKAIRQAQEDTADQHGLFEAALETADKDRFETITEFFSRGVMNTHPPSK
ncbi:hypothetical protein ABW19_dt0200708 [Dactylella cylindrospora]|nr:hypothetical protein ABW19_dt0200708 [Dactylella cylindrospora]